MRRLTAHKLAKSYGAPPRPVLRGVSLEVEAGEFVCLLGPSGCGKSTLLRILASLEHSDAGTVSIDGRSVIEPSRDRILVFQDDVQLFPWLTVWENVAVGLRASESSASPGEREAKKEMGSHTSRKARRESAEEYLSLVRLPDAAELYPHELSEGMKRRVAIARAFAAHPGVLLMDEPFASLDAQTRSRLQDLLLSLWKERGTSILFVTHDIQESVLLGDRVLVLSAHGRILGEFPVGLPRPRPLRDESFWSLHDSIRFAIDRQ